MGSVMTHPAQQMVNLIHHKPVISHKHGNYALQLYPLSVLRMSTLSVMIKQ